MSDVSARLIAGRYRVGRLLGQGGMGRVWAAHDDLLDREVAVKEIRPPRGIDAAAMDELCARTLREARAIARVNHPNVIRVLDVVQDHGLPCIVMELLPSRSLYERLRREGPMDPEEVARIGLSLLAALQAAHREGLLHRDVKPANVLIADDGRVVLTDFGLVSIAGEPGMTTTGIVLGSPSYLAPEMALDGAVGPSSDLWSLGATMYAAVEGRPPYSKSTPAATLAALVTEPPRRPRQPGVLSDVLDGLLERDPARRIDADTAEGLLRAAAGDALPPAPVGPAARHRPRQVFLTLGAAAALLAFAAFALRYGMPAGPAAAGSPSLTPSALPTAPEFVFASASASPSPTPSRRPPTAEPTSRATRAAVAPAASVTPQATTTTTTGGRAFTVVVLRSRANGRYVTADDAGASPLIAFPDAAGTWETWDELDLGGGDIALRAEINRKYVTADSAGAQPLIASKSSVGKSETFHLVHNADGTVSLLSRANGKYVTAADDGADPLINDQTTIGVSEKFDRTAY